MKNNKKVKVLILGGTKDARVICEKLAELIPSLTLIYSVAGLVRMPDVPAQVISGGFRQFGGLAAYIESERIELVIDATHPYAAKMTTTAVLACQNMGIVCYRFSRPEWIPEAGDQWHFYENFNELIALIKIFPQGNIFLSAGQFSLDELEILQSYAVSREVKIILRTAVKPKFDIPKGIEWFKAIGPFGLVEERQTLLEYGIGILVTKNSGGNATSAKLTAARALNVSVCMQTRPCLEVNGVHEFHSIKLLISKVIKTS